MASPDSAGVPQAFADLTISVPFNDIEAVQRAFRENPKEIAAVILEPIPANAGLYFPRGRIPRRCCAKNAAATARSSSSMKS